MLSFSVPGTITDFYVEEGQRVAKGQVLARVRSDSYVNAGNIADAELAEARDAYARLKKLHDADALPEIKWVEVQNKLKQAENAAEMSRRASRMPLFMLRSAVWSAGNLPESGRRS